MSSPLIFSNPWIMGGWILVEPEAISVIEPYRQATFNDKEAGGILLGYRRGNHLHVLKVTCPEDGDRRTRHSFDRLDKRHRAVALNLWRHSKKKFDYLGEWHTHPEHNPNPSSFDRSEWRKLMGKASVPLLFWIEGISDRWVGVGSRGTVAKAQAHCDTAAQRTEYKVHPCA